MLGGKAWWEDLYLKVAQLWHRIKVALAQPWEERI
jgi:hypothetical protein